MAVLTRKKSYVFGGTLSADDADGLPVEYHAGDPVPDAFLAQRNRGEIEVLTQTGMLREIGAVPTPRPAQESPRVPTPAEILRATEAWPNAAVVDGRVADGPRGYEVCILDRKARDTDLEDVCNPGPTGTVIVHRVGGQWVATISLARLAPLLAAAGFRGAR